MRARAVAARRLAGMVSHDEQAKASRRGIGPARPAVSSLLSFFPPYLHPVYTPLPFLCFFFSAPSLSFIHQKRMEKNMQDLVSIALIGAFAALILGLAAGCGKLEGRP